MIRTRSLIALGILSALIISESGARTAISYLSSSVAPGVTKASESSDLHRNVKRVFSHIRELEQEKRAHSQHYLASLDEEELAAIYARATAPQSVRPDNADFLALARNRVKQDREKALREIQRYGGAFLSEKGKKKLQEREEALTSELTALGVEAIKAIISQLSLYGGRDRWNQARIAEDAVGNMGTEAVPALMPLMQSADPFQRQVVVDLLAQSAAPQSKETLYDALRDDSPHVRRSALEGMLRLGPDVLGKERLVKTLVRLLQDDDFWCLWRTIEALEEHGDRRAIEPLAIIEAHHIGRGKADIRFRARRALNTIHRRCLKEVERGAYTEVPLSQSECVKAAACDNTGIRRNAIRRLEMYKDESVVRFLVDRIPIERDAKAMTALAHSLRAIMAVPKGETKSTFDAAWVQLAFNRFFSVGRTAVNYVNTTRECDGNLTESVDHAEFHADFLTTERPSQALRLAAMEGAAAMLRLAHSREIDLQNTVAYKGVVMGYKNSKGHVPCYAAITALVAVCGDAHAAFSSSERGFLNQQFSQYLHTTAPHANLIEAVGRVGDQRHTQRLVELLQHDNPALRKRAATALGNIADRDALALLQKVLESAAAESPDQAFPIRELAQETIGQIKKAHGQ